jgi:hypothetical protein
MLQQTHLGTVLLMPAAVFPCGVDYGSSINNTHSVTVVCLKGSMFVSKKPKTGGSSLA